MSRRLFLERFAALLGVSAGTGLAASEARAAERAPIPRQIELQRSPVAGFQYHRGEAIWQQLEIGASLNLIRESENRFDERAVRVQWQGEKLGYVPRVDNATISHLLDSGRHLTAEIVALELSDNPWNRIEFVIYLHI